MSSDEPASRSPTGGSRPRIGNGSQERTTVLVVEDEFLIRMAVADYLRDCGFRVLEAGNAEEAQAVFRVGEPIEIMFSDVQMPGDLNGFGLARWVRDTYPDVQVILTSGVRAIAKQAEEMCSDSPFLGKPYSHEELLHHIRRLLEAPPQRR